MKKNILITGPPGCGKTTLVQKVAAGLADVRIAGFYTAEIRRNGIRQGFELTSLSGDRGILAHVSFRKPPGIGKYGVDVAGFERFLKGLAPGAFGPELFIIDEIGKMECLSPLFCSMVAGILDSGTPCIATIAEQGGGIIAEIRNREDVETIRLSSDNRDMLAGVIASSARRIIAGGKGKGP